MGRKRLAILVGFFWLIIIIGFIGVKEFTLRTGEEVSLKTVPIDPRDLFRGDYVILAYDISTLDLNNIPADYADFEIRDKIYVSLNKENGYGIPSRIYKNIPKSEKLFIKGIVKNIRNKRLSVEYGIESYFVPEGKGREIERIREGTNAGKSLETKVCIDKFGNAVIKSLSVIPQKVKPSIPRQLTYPSVPAILQQPESIQGDVWVRFDSAHCNDFYPFSSASGVLGKVYWARFDSTDNLYREIHGEECCLPGGCRQAWGSYYVNSTRMGPWVVERKEISRDRYKLLIRGSSQADCICGSNAYVKGGGQVVPTSGWHIVEVNKCEANSDNRGREVYCKVDKQTGMIKFAGGSTCGGSVPDCCCCIDSGNVDIEIIVEKR